MDNTNSFSYTYSAAQRQEVERIRNKYLPQEEDKLDQLRKLHNRATLKAKRRAVILGTIGALILGTGMSLIMTELGTLIHMDTGLAMAVGVCVGVVGLILVALTYPVYNRVLRKERERIAPQILRLTEELLK
jgi:hypothetical protein